MRNTRGAYYGRLLLLLALLTGQVPVFSQVVVTLSGEEQTISPVMVGFNGRSTEGPSWTDYSFISIVDSLYPGSVRYPAGTQANYWDWRYGTFIEGSGKTAQYLYRIPDFVAGLPDESIIIYVVNMARPTPATGIPLDAPQSVLESLATLQLKAQDMIDALAEFEESGKLPEAVEFGNEFYFDNEHAAIYAANPQLYLAHSKVLAGLIKDEYPSLKILLCTSKGGTSLRDSWNNAVFTAIESDAELASLIYGVVQHHYINDSYGDPTPVTNLATADRAIAEGFIYTRDIVSDYQMVPDGFPLWITEYGATKENAEATWATGLRAAAMTLGMINLGSKIEMLSLHHITRDPNVIDRDQIKVGPEGMSMGLIGKGARGMQFARRLDFTDNPITVDNVKSLHGYRFSDNGLGSVIILNISRNSFNNTDISGLLTTGSNRTATQISSSMPYLTPVYDGTNIAVSKFRVDGAIIDIPPYSITLIEGSVESTRVRYVESDTEVIIFPVPFTNEVSVLVPVEDQEVTIAIFDIVGSLRYSIRSAGGLITISPDLPSGIYFMEVRTGSSRFLNRIIKQ